MLHSHGFSGVPENSEQVVKLPTAPCMKAILYRSDPDKDNSNRTATADGFRFHTEKAENDGSGQAGAEANSSFTLGQLMRVPPGQKAYYETSLIAQAWYARKQC